MKENGTNGDGQDGQRSASGTPDAGARRSVKLHKNLVAAAIAVLEGVFTSGQVAEKSLDTAFKATRQWGKRDRDFIANLVYAVLRGRRRLASGGSEESLWSTAAAAVALLYPELEEFPDWPEWQGLSPEQLRAHSTRSWDVRAVRLSLPDWLDELGQSQLGERWEAEISAQDAMAPVVLRTNTLKVSREKLMRTLAQEGVDARPLGHLPDALELVTRRNLSGLECFKVGWFEIQDAASQLVAPFVDARPGMRIMDACAGAGGKALHLAALTRNEAQIVACDIHGARLQELEKRADRAGARLHARLWSARLLESLAGQADRVLIDAPCSGLGTLRRQPDIKWRLNPAGFARYVELQREVLDKYHRLLSPQGQLVYATCSIMPAENEEQVAWFCANYPFRVLEEKRVWPSEGGGDGFYLARLARV